MSHLGAMLTDAREQRGLRVLESFFAAFTEGRLDAVQRYTAPSFSWFGRAIDGNLATPRAFEFQRVAKMSFAKARMIPPSIVELVSAAKDPSYLFEGSVRPTEYIALVDVKRGSAEVTVGAVIADIEGEARVARIFDPGKLRTALEQLRKSVS